MQRERLADFLRTRRAALQPEDVGLPRGRRRRAPGLRREEVAVLTDLSVDYYNRLEQPRGPRPSEQVLAALARGLRLTRDERDHLFRLAGYVPPARGDARTDHLNPGMMRILDGLRDAAAEVVDPLGETLYQTPLAVALTGDERGRRGPERSRHYRWFTDPAARALHPAEDHAERSRTFAAHLLSTPGPRAEALAAELGRRSPEFAALAATHPVFSGYCATERLLHPRVGPLELHCQTLVDPDGSQVLVVRTAAPGSAEALRLLAVLGPEVAHAGPGG